MNQNNSKTGKNTNNSSFLVQGSILAIASIVSRIIGLLYRSPLTAILGDLGNDYYSTAFEIYSLLLLISSMSLPLAVSKMVSARVSQGRMGDAYRVFKAALGFAVCSGLAAGLIVFFFADYFAAFLKTPFCVFALRVLAPTLFIVAILGVIRGFFQGLGTMMPSAVSQIVEQIINAIVSVVAAYSLFRYGAKIGAVLGNTQEYSAAYGAAGGTRPASCHDAAAAPAGVPMLSPGRGMLALSSGFSKRAYCPLKVRRTSPTEPLRCLAMIISALPRKSSPLSLL